MNTSYTVEYLEFNEIIEMNEQLLDGDFDIFLAELEHTQDDTVILNRVLDRLI